MIGFSEWDVVCPGCPGNDVRVSEVPGCPVLTSEDQAQMLAHFHQQIYSHTGELILR